LLAQANNFTLSVEVVGAKNTKGEVQFSLYNKDGTIPDKDMSRYFKIKRSKIKDGKAKVLFKDLSEGRYAVSIYHDQNNNHKIDQGFILPNEGVGLSNFETINLFNPPNFKAASFSLNQDKKIKIKLIYF